jgi:3-phenylpropionate/trans-cinnamate dioxygenase ferredoxin reductase subunit
MTEQRHPFVIVGAGLAGASAAAQLRKEASTAPIVLLGSEPHRPYERPPLSKEYLRGEAPREEIDRHPRAFYDEQAIELRMSTRVTGIAPGERVVVLEGGERLRFERLLLATGSAPRQLDVPGNGLDGVHTLRTIDDADAIRAATRQAHEAVVIGGGWIGAEVSASLRQLGLDVAMVISGRVLLEHVLGPEVGSVYQDLHLEHGVKLLPGRGVTALVGSRKVEAVELSDGTRIGADLVIVGIGAEPRIGLAKDAGLEVGEGVIVDEHLETSAPGIYAAGDIAEAWHPWLGSRIRVEHFENARHQGRAAARSLLGTSEAYDRLPSFFSDQYDLSMEYVGHAPTWDRVVFRGMPASRSFVAFWLAGGRVVAGMNANVPGVYKALAELIRARQTISPELLADPGIPLQDHDALASPSARRRPGAVGARSLG